MRNTTKKNKKNYIIPAGRQLVSIVIISIVTGLCTNQMRASGIPLVAKWTVEERLVDGKGDTMGIPLLKAKTAFEENRALFLDARGEDSFAQGHIKGAKSLPWHSVDDYPMEIIQELSRQTLIITYCDGETCNLSHDLAVFLKEMGFLNTKVLVNGWTAWKEEGLPVEIGMGESPVTPQKNQGA